MGDASRDRLRPARSCGPARELISLALDGEITRVEAIRLRVHLASCPGCRAYRRRLDCVAATLRESAPALAHAAAPWPARRRAVLPGRIAVLAAAAALALVGLAALAGTAGSPAHVGALSATQGLPVYGGLSPEQGYSAYVYKQPRLPRLD